MKRILGPDHKHFEKEEEKRDERYTNGERVARICRCFPLSSIRSQ